ncbi:MAG: DUF2232 domain-containing protein [Tissierellia bacterium]|nr:DUF2232 domain-containing protein [Tissierellia bacterium]MDD4726558.1 DUF2232 domain-containing protein [Tissierellia bacterium]
MDDDNFKDDILETVGIIGFMVVYALLAIHSFPLLLFLFPAPFIYIGVKKDLKIAIGGITIVSLLVGLMADTYSGIVLFELFMPLSLVIIYEITNRKKSTEVLLYSTVVFFISCLLLYGLIQDITGASIITQMEESFREIVNVQVEMFRESGLTNYELSRTRDQLKNTYSYIVSILPAILIILSMFASYINYYASAIALRRSGIGIASIPNFSRFKLPSTIIPGIVVIFVALSLAKGLDIPKFDAIVLNIIVFTWFIFSVQGLSVIDYFMINRKFKTIIRIIIIILIAFIIPVGSILSLIGFIDAIFDFRKLNKNKF